MLKLFIFFPALFSICSTEVTLVKSYHKSFYQCEFSALLPLPDGNIVTGCGESPILIFNPLNGSIVGNLTKQTGYVVYLRLLKNGNILSGSYDWNPDGSYENSLKIWNPNNGYMYAETKLFFESLVVLPTGNIACGKKYGNITVFNPSNLNVITEFKAINRHVHLMTVLSNGDLAITFWGFKSDASKEITIFDSENFSFKKKIQIEFGINIFTALANNLLAVASAGYHTITIWDTNTNVLIATLKTESQVWFLLALSDGNLVSVSQFKSSEKVQIWNSKDWSMIDSFQSHPEGYVFDFVSLPNGNIVSHDFEILKIWKYY